MGLFPRLMGPKPAPPRTARAPKVMIQKVDVDAILPQHMTEGAAGADLAVPTSLRMQAGETRLIDLGYRIQIPEGYMGQVVSRSGWARKGLTVANAPGIIDSDYRGNCMVLLHAKEKIVIEAGTRVAQLLLLDANDFLVLEGNIPVDTHRGSGGFGSTGG